MRKIAVLAIFLFLLVIGISNANAVPALVYDNVKTAVNSDATVTVEFDIINSGTSFDGNLLVEVQMVGPNEKFFAVVQGQDTCDASFPDNVHVLVTGGIKNSEKVHIRLKTPVMPAATYDVKALSVDGCCVGDVDKPLDGQCNNLDPFNWGIKIGSVTVPNIGQGGAVKGDGLCTGTENAITAPEDCGTCGDGVCQEPGGINECWSDCQEIPVKTPASAPPGDRDGDGALDSEDKCPDIAPINYLGDKITNVPQVRSKDNALYGCPVIQIVSVKVLGQGAYGQGVYNNLPSLIPSDTYVPVMISLIKDDNFDLTNLKLEAGIYEVDSPFLGTYATVPTPEVLGTRNLQEIPTCNKEANVQAADLLELSAFSFGTTKNEATYILTPKPKLVTGLTQKTYAIQATTYKECGSALTSNAQARVVVDKTITNPNQYHNQYLKPTCVTVAGAGADECQGTAFTGTSGAGGGAQVGGTKDALTIDELGDATQAGIAAASCDYTEECKKREGFEVNCVDADKLRIKVPRGIIEAIGDGLSISKKDGVCLAEPVEKPSFCDFAEKIAFFDIAADKCTSGGIILVGGIIILFMLALLLGGKK